MTEAAHPDNAVLDDGDIVFDCPSCGKSLGIDVRGAGYLVTCPHCSVEILVPEVEYDDDPDPAPAGDAGRERIEVTDTTRMLNENLQALRQTVAADQQAFEKLGSELNELQKVLDRMTAILSEAEPR